MAVICFYHNSDLDGKCAGAIVRKHHPRCVLAGSNYGYPFPWPSTPWEGRSPKVRDEEPKLWHVMPSDTVYIVDFSWPMDEMLRVRDYLQDGGGRLIWIDHHKTAIDDYEGAIAGGADQIHGLRRIGDAGCELTWEYLETEEAPRAVYLLGRYDVWDHKDPDVLPFQMGMRQKSWWPDDEEWPAMFDDGLALDVPICNEGRVILGYATSQRESTARSYGRDIRIRLPDGEITGVAINTPDRCSQAFEAVLDPSRHFFMAAYMHTPHKPQKWSVSLYSARDDVNVGAIAKMFGGGGHRGAAGFTCDDLPFIEAESAPEVS